MTNIEHGLDARYVVVAATVRHIASELRRIDNEKGGQR